MEQRKGVTKQGQNYGRGSLTNKYTRKGEKLDGTSTEDVFINNFQATVILSTDRN
jgi:hypothetical protein